MTALSPLALRLRASAPMRLMTRIPQFLAVLRSRRALAQLDDHLLRDIGLTRHEAEAEANRRLWDPPLHWRG